MEQLELVDKEELDMKNQFHRIWILFDQLPGSGPGPDPRRREDEKNE